MESPSEVTLYARRKRGRYQFTSVGKFLTYEAAIRVGMKEWGRGNWLIEAGKGRTPSRKEQLPSQAVGK